MKRLKRRQRRYAGFLHRSIKMEKEKTENKNYMSETNGDSHNLIPDNDSWIEDAKGDMEEYLELNGVYIRQ